MKINVVNWLRVLVAVVNALSDFVDTIASARNKSKSSTSNSVNDGSVK